MYVLVIYLFLINAAGMLLMLADKLKAKRNLWRISESCLVGIAAAGGSLGVLVGMRAFRHKTKHPKFSVGVPILLALHIAALSWFFAKIL